MAETTSDGWDWILLPEVLGDVQARFSAKLAAVAAGRDLTPLETDKRFTDPAWTTNPALKATLQGYLAWSQAWLEHPDLEGMTAPAMKRRFVVDIVTSALSPTNSLATNPSAIRKAVDTGGQSLIRGYKNFLDDLVNNSGMPKQVNTSAFVVGENAAATPGAVIFRNDVLEILQYTPTTARVTGTPVLVVPAPINKYYVWDLAPGKSFVEHAVGQGVPVFLVSWRNPPKEAGTWGLETHCAAVVEALDAIIEVSRSEVVNFLGICAGGIVTAATAGHLASVGLADRVGALSFAVSMLDSSQPSMIGALVPEDAAEPDGPDVVDFVVDGQAMNRFFAWMRPGDMVWSYWVNNYLLGEDPPSFDIMAWNADAKNVPSRLTRDLNRVFARNSFCTPGDLQVLGKGIDLSALHSPVFVMAGDSDYIAPWKAVYANTKLFGQDAEFVLARAGHVQSIVSPPGGKKAAFWTGPLAKDADAWLAAAEHHADSWWPQWTEFMKRHSAVERPARKTLGSRAHPVLDAAPGTYVRKS